jgi:protein TonB
MIAKKSKKADLERKRFAFLQIGLVITGALVFAAFEYTTVKMDSIAKIDKQDEVFQMMYEQPVEEIVYHQPTVTKRIQIQTVPEEVKPTDKPIPDPSDKVNPDIIGEQPITDPGDEGGSTKGIYVPEEKEWMYVEQMPEFPGGDAAMLAWVADNINLPQYAERLNGTVYVRFVVDKDGSVTKVAIAKSLHQDYDNASLAVVKKMPKWTPGEQAGKKVKVQYDLPIKFLNR